MCCLLVIFFFFSSRRRHTRYWRDWSSDVCSSDLTSCDYVAQLRLAFATAPHLKCLTLPHNVTRWPVLQKVRGHANNALPQFVSAGFQVLFHSPPGVLFTFPSRYYTLSVTR